MYFLPFSNYRIFEFFIKTKYQVFTKEEIEFIADLCKEFNCLYLSDEVYEWLLYDDNQHFRVGESF